MFRKRRQVTCEMCISKAFRRPCGKNKSPECREISLELKQIAAKYRSRSNNRTREISLKKKLRTFVFTQYYRNKLFTVVTKTWNDLQPPQKLNNHLDNIFIILPRRFSCLIVVDNILGGAGGFIQVTYSICVTYCHLACLKRHLIVCEWLLNLLRWLQVVPCSHNYELFAVNDNSKTAKYDMIHAYLCSRPTSVGQDQGSHHTTNSLWQNEILHAF